ncbi:MAG: RDD family protein [Planctomycetaceae bacterium]
MSVTLPGQPHMGAIDLEHVIETPENVVLTYQLAGPATRLSAYLVDLLVRIGLVFALHTYLLSPLSLAGGLAVGLTFIAYFIVEWAYFGLCEWYFRGKTLGKYLLGLRVIHEGGYPLSLWGAVLRNFVRAGDALPAVLLLFPTYGAGFLTMLAAGRFRRLGDLVARTLVIEEQRVAAPREPVILETIQPLSRSEISGYVPAAQTLTVIEEFLGRRHVLAYARGHAMALLLARALAAKLKYQGPRDLVEQYPMAFVARVYATFHPTLEMDAGDIEPEAAGVPGAARVAAPAGAAL